MDTRAGLDDVEKIKFLTLQGLELRPLGRPGGSKRKKGGCLTKQRFKETYRPTTKQEE
jgi:hypothetical protein